MGQPTGAPTTLGTPPGLASRQSLPDLPLADLWRLAINEPSSDSNSKTYGARPLGRSRVAMPPVRPTRPPTVVITGVGMVSPIGIGRQSFWESIRGRRSGIRPLSFDHSSLPIHFGGEVRDFDAKEYVRPRKSLKVMSREIQFAVTAAELAMTDAGLPPGTVDPDRLGVVYGADMIYCEPEELVEAYRGAMPEGTFDFSRWGTDAMPRMYPLWMLKYLPNMPACHVAIANDARGPCNSTVLGDASSLAAIAEGFQVIKRGMADCMIVGGTANRLHPTPLVFRSNQWYSHWDGAPEEAARPFDAARSGQVPGEGAAALILESLDHARARGATILARVVAAATRHEPVIDEVPPRGTAIAASIRAALDAAGLQPADIGHVNAHGFGSIPHDRSEAQAIGTTLGDVPVTAPKSYFGNLGAASGAVEMIASVIGLANGEIPPTLNYDRADSECPVNVVRESRSVEKPAALLLNQATTGQAVAIVIARQ